MADKFSNKVVGEDVKDFGLRRSDASMRGSNMGVDKATLERGGSEPKKFKVVEDDKFARVPQGHDRV